MYVKMQYIVAFSFYKINNQLKAQQCMYRFTWYTDLDIN